MSRRPAAATRPSAAGERIGLVLGAGGPTGHAFHAGVLAALAAATGWEPRRAACLVGTSAGAEVAALLRAGMSAADLLARIAGGALSPAGAGPAGHYLRPDHGPFPFRLLWPLLRSSPTWLGQRLRLLRRRPGPGPFSARLLPLGRVELAAQAAAFDRMFPAGWPPEPLWLVAGRVDDGQRVVFGRADAPATGVGAAVAASGAVPGINPPLAIAGRLYVDGGLRSSTNLDVLAEPAAGAPLDRVLVSAPLSCAPAYGPRSWLRPARRIFRRRLAAEARSLRHRGAAVHLLQPSGAVLAAMGINPFAVQRMDRVARAAYRATRAALSRTERRDGPLATLAAALRAAAG